MVKNSMKYFAEDKVYLDKKELLSTNFNTGSKDNIIYVSGDYNLKRIDFAKYRYKKSIKSVRLNR